EAEDDRSEANEAVQELACVAGEQVRVDVVEPLHPFVGVVVASGDFAGVLIDEGVNAVAFGRLRTEVPRSVWARLAPAHRARLVARVLGLDPSRHVVER